MAKNPAFKGLAAAFLVALWAAPTWAAPTVAQMLAFKPKFDDVQISTPAPDEYAGCEVKLVTGSKAGSSGWMLLDSKKQPLRKFFDSNGDKQIDVWSYYKDGVEVYREMDSNFDQRPDQFRWLGTAGMKWGVDVDQDGKIDTWRMISAEEAAQEAFVAVATGDYDRLKALFPSETEMQALRLPQAETDRIAKALAAAPTRFKAAREKLPAKATFVRVESGAPGVWTAEELGSAQDVFKIVNRTVLYTHGKDQHDFLQIPEMIQVGLAWRVVGAPSNEPIDTNPMEQRETPKMRELLAQLSDHDAKNANKTTGFGINPDVQAYHKVRIGLVQQILQESKDAKQQETWMKQIFDGLAQAAVAGDERSLGQLGALAAQYEKASPGTNLTGYVVFRKVWATYAPIMIDPKKTTPKLQEEYNDQLAKFVQAYPKAEDAADALHQLAMQSEFNGKDEEAKRWYKQIAANFPESHLAPLAQGCIRRLDSVGQTFELTAGMLGSPMKTFDIAQVKGKTVVVYYWASYCNACIGDFARMKKLLDDNKDVALVCVNLDDSAETGATYVAKNSVPGIHVFQQGKEATAVGLRSPLAVNYGIFGLPNLFLVGPDGKVLSRTVQVGDLEETIKKASK